MNTGFLAGGLLGGSALLAGGISYIIAETLFNRVIPRQDGVKVDTSEMADAETFEGYRKMMVERKEWFVSQNLQKVSIESRDGMKLSGTYLQAGSTPSKRIILALHGYTSAGGSFCSQAKFFFENGIDVLMPDLRAHGESEGDYVGFGVLDRFDCLRWIDYIINQFGEDKEIILYGISMGAATALMTTGFENLQPQVKGVIADCGFTSPFDVFSHVLKRDYNMPQFPVMTINEKLCKKRAGYGFNDYSTLEAMKTNKLPILFIHGENDRFVPLWMSEKNYEICQSKKKLLVVKNAGHGASYYQDHELYEQTVLDFLNNYICK